MTSSFVELASALESQPQNVLWIAADGVGFHGPFEQLNRTVVVLPLVGDHAQKIERAVVIRDGLEDLLVDSSGLIQAPALMEQYSLIDVVFILQNHYSLRNPPGNPHGPQG